jgi:hypothetical protein
MVPMQHRTLHITISRYDAMIRLCNGEHFDSMNAAALLIMRTLTEMK